MLVFLQTENQINIKRIKDKNVYKIVTLDCWTDWLRKFILWVDILSMYAYCILEKQLTKLPNVLTGWVLDNKQTSIVA